MSKYLITGVAGFVGRYFVDYLQQNEQNATIIGIDVISECNMPIIYKQLDLNNSNTLEKLISEHKPDYIVHLASISSVGQSWQDPAYCFNNNTNIMLNILNSVKELELKTRILSIGSSEEYGSSSEILREDMPLNPQNPYAVAKVSQELLCKLYAQNMNIDVIMTRSFNHIGPRQSERFVVPSFMRQLVNISQGKENKMLVGNIEVARDFTDVRDVVNAYYKILHEGKRGEVYNVCSGKAYRLKEVIAIAEEVLGIKANIEVDSSRLRPNDVMLIQGDNTKLVNELSWQPTYEIKQTISDILENMRG